jgi:hypothetical protein
MGFEFTTHQLSLVESAALIPSPSQNLSHSTMVLDPFWAHGSSIRGPGMDRTSARSLRLCVKLTTQQAYALLEKHGSYITELCDRCGKGIGPVRFTRRGPWS